MITSANMVQLSLKVLYVSDNEISTSKLIVNCVTLYPNVFYQLQITH